MSDIERLAALLHGIAAGCSEGRTICVTHPNYHKRDAARLIAAGVALPPSDPAAPFSLATLLHDLGLGCLGPTDAKHMEDHAADAARLIAAGVTLDAPPSDPADPPDDTAADWYRQGWEAGNKAPSDPAAPLDVERLARAMRAISLIPSLYRGPVAAWVPTAEALAREYAALAPKEAES